MDPSRYDIEGLDIAWCPGCGNFSILRALKLALSRLDILPRDLVIVSGIGQAAKTPHYLRTHVFNGLHGRALPPATAIKTVNPGLTVIVESGDGDMYGEGGNHLLHAIRRNPDITCLVHDNMVYGLTKGQASPTSRPGFKTPVQVGGVFEEPFNPVALAVAMGASFVARALATDIERTADVIVRAVRHRGFSLVDILQPCVSFNKLNTLDWFREHTRELPGGYDPGDRMAAMRTALEEDLALGVIFQREGRPAFEEQTGIYGLDPTPLPFRAEDRGPGLTAVMRNKR
ncbi:MAG: 2-oxoacid ferredoxin oxidoreductase [Candidatus Aminicenantes bacterium]|nr:2-oxoacid ferredoxin oxidoreductase [Candidatus Aminicenantes bacterium]